MTDTRYRKFKDSEVDSLFMDGAFPLKKLEGNIQNHIADVSGGTTKDTQARATIASILNALENYGILKKA